MPGFVGAVQIISISSAGVFNIGDVFQIQPNSSSKAFAGAGSFNTGDEINLTNGYSTITVSDNDGIDQPNVFNL